MRKLAVVAVVLMLVLAGSIAPAPAGGLDEPTSHETV